MCSQLDSGEQFTFGALAQAELQSFVKFPLTTRLLRLVGATEGLTLLWGQTAVTLKFGTQTIASLSELCQDT